MVQIRSNSLLKVKRQSTKSHVVDIVLHSHIFVVRNYKLTVVSDIIPVEMNESINWVVHSKLQTNIEENMKSCIVSVSIS